MFIIVLLSFLLRGCLAEEDKPIPNSNIPFSQNEVFEAQSPDGSKRLKVTEIGDSTSWYTQVCIDFGQSGECVYAANGRNLGIITFWKDNNCIIIKTKKIYKSDQKKSQTEFMGNIVNVEYYEK